MRFSVAGNFFSKLAFHEIMIVLIREMSLIYEILGFVGELWGRCDTRQIFSKLYWGFSMSTFWGIHRKWADLELSIDKVFREAILWSIYLEATFWGIHKKIGKFTGFQKLPNLFENIIERHLIKIQISQNSSKSRIKLSFDTQYWLSFCI
jgi:hypothetical protein